MNTEDLIGIVAQVTEQDKGLVSAALRAAFEVIADALADQETVRLSGLGRLQVRQVGIERWMVTAPHGKARLMAPYAVRFRPVERLRQELHIRANYA